MYNPDYIVSPGEVIREYMSHPKISKKELAEKLEIDYDEVVKLLDGNLQISPKIANGLMFLFGRPYAFWIKMDIQYQNDKKRLEDGKENR